MKFDFWKDPAVKDAVVGFLITAAIVLLALLALAEAS